MDSGGYLHFGTDRGPFLTIGVPTKHEGADRWLAFWEGRWRRIHIQVRRLYVIVNGERVTFTMDGL